MREGQVRAGMSRRGLLGQAAGWGAALAAAACGLPGAGQPSPAGLKDAAVTVRYLTWWPTERFGTVNAWKTALKDEWPKVNLEVEQTPLGEFNTKFQVGLTSGTPPDVVLSNSHAQTRWYDSGVHLDLSSMLARDKISLQRDYALMGTELWCGKTYALPMDADANAIFYNKTMLERAGLKDPWADGKADWSLNDMFTMAKRLTQDLDRDGTPDQWGIWLTYDHTSHAAQYIWTRGGDVADFQKMRYILDSPASIEGHRQLHDWLVKDRIVLPNAEASRIGREAPGRDAFSAGKVAFRVRAVADVVKYQREVAGAFDWDVIHFPKFDDRHPGIPLVSGNPHCVTKESKVAEQSYQWAKLIATARGMEILGQTLSLPALKSKQEVYLKTKVPPPHVKVFQDVFAKPYGIHFRHHLTNDSWAIYGKQINAIMAGEAPLVGGLQEANRLMNDTIKYGDCQPYKGLTIPIQPKK